MNNIKILIANKLARSIHFNKKSLEATVISCIKKQEIYGNKHIFSSDDINKIEKYIISDEFLYPLAKKYIELFTEEELNELKKIYTSDLMKKFNDNFCKIIIPFFEYIDNYFSSFSEHD